MLWQKPANFMPQPKINLMNKFQLCLSRWLVARTLKMNFAPPNLRKFKLFWAAQAPIFGSICRLCWVGKCYESTYTRGGVFLSKSKSIIFLSSELHIWPGPKLLLSVAARCSCQFPCPPSSRTFSLHACKVTHQKKYSHSKRTFNIYFVNVPSQRADSTRDNVIPETSSSARRKFLSYSFMVHARSFSLTLILTGRVPHAEQPACRVTGHINNC